MTVEKVSKRGGARPGAGRKSHAALVAVATKLGKPSGTPPAASAAPGPSSKTLPPARRAAARNEPDVYAVARRGTADALEQLQRIITKSKDEKAVIAASKAHLDHCKMLLAFGAPTQATKAPTAKEVELGKKAVSEIAAQTAGEDTEWGDVLRH